MMRAEYEIVDNEVTESTLVIRDIGCFSGKMTVTNDVEAVVQDLIDRQILDGTMQLFYYDSDGQKDEIIFDEDGFVEFAPGER